MFFSFDCIYLIPPLLLCVSLSFSSLSLSLSFSLRHHHGELKGQPRGFAFVEFQTKASAILACTSANGVELGGRPLVIRFAEERETGNGASGGGGGGDGELKVDFKTTNERRKGEINARISAVEGQGGRGGGGGAPYDRYAYVPAAIPSIGFSRERRSDESALSHARSKVRAIEDKLRAMEEERLYERRIANRATIRVDSAPSVSSSSSSSANNDTRRRQDEAFAQEPHPDRRDHVHPSRREEAGRYQREDDQRSSSRRDRSRSRERQRSRSPRRR